MPLVPIDEIRVDERFASRLPDPGPAAFAGLVEDVRTRGILVDLLVTQDGLLLDGHRRLAAARQLGMKMVPVKRVQVSGDEGWEEAAMLCVNICRRQMNEAERAVLGSSLLRLERARAQDRKRLGQAKGRVGRRRRGLVEEHASPQPTDTLADTGRKEPDRATQRVADQVGVSRKTLERVELLKQKTPGVLQKVLQGELSVAGAYRGLRREENAQLVAEEASGSIVGLESLESVYGKYRTVYLDPPWGSENQKPGSRQQLERLPLSELAHKDGCHFWIWTPWPIIRKGIIHELLAIWQIRWVAELLWDRGSGGKGRWFHKRTEVLVLGAAGTPTLLRTDVEPILTVGSEHEGKGKVDGFRGLIELLSPGPRIEVLCGAPHEKWDCWEGKGFFEVNSFTDTVTSGDA